MQILFYLAAFFLAVALAVRILGYLGSARYKVPKKEKEISHRTQKLTVETPEITNCFIYRDNGKERKARYENGVVYAIYENSKESIIGYYSYSDGRWTVRCAYDKGEIGRIDKDDLSALVYLSRIGDVKRCKQITDLGLAEESKQVRETAEKSYNDMIRRTKMLYLCGEAISGIVRDFESNKTVGFSNGDDTVGDAAAFICLQYSCVSEGKYHDFYDTSKYMY